MARNKLFTTVNVLIGILVILVLIQLIRIDKTNPPVETANDFITIANPPQDVALILKESCYDCHSNTTIYPWYTNVAPVSWWLKNHINDGRKHLNFSEWRNYTAKKADHKLEETVEMVEEGEMPLTSYTLLHPKAKLTPAQRDKLVAWLKDYRKS